MENQTIQVTPLITASTGGSLYNKEVNNFKKYGVILTMIIIAITPILLVLKYLKKNRVIGIIIAICFSAFMGFYIFLVLAFGEFDFSKKK